MGVWDQIKEAKEPSVAQVTTPQEPEQEQTKGVWGEIKEQPSRTRSLVGAPVKGFVQTAQDISEMADPMKMAIRMAAGPSQAEEKQKAIFQQFLEEALPTREEAPEQILQRAGALAPYAFAGGAGIPAALAETGLGALGGYVAKELGGGPVAEAVGEVGGMSIPGMLGKLPQKLSRFATKAELAPRQARLVEKAAQPPSKILETLSIPTKRSEALFKSTEKSLAKAKDEVIKNAFPATASGEGIQGITKSVNEAYDLTKSAAQNLGMVDPAPIQREVRKLQGELSKTVKPSADKQKAIDYLSSVTDRLEQGALPAEDVINWFQDLNETIPFGRGGYPSMKKLRSLKDSAKQSLRMRGTEGKQVASLFEKANEAHIQKINFQDVSKILDKAFGEEGINFKKLDTLLDNKENAKLFQKSLGDKNFNFLRDVAKSGKNIKNLQGKIDTIFGRFFKAAKYKMLLGSLATMAFGMPPKAAGAAMGGLAGMEIAGAFATKLMTDTTLQNVYKRFIKGISQNKQGMALNAGRRLVEEYEKYSKEQDEDSNTRINTLERPKNK